MRRAISNKRGGQMVEAAIVMPIIILISVLMIRLFVFYLDILTSGIKEHKAAIEAHKAYTGAGIKHYESNIEIAFVKGGLLGFDVTKKIQTEGFICNEDSIIRAGKLLEKNK